MDLQDPSLFLLCFDAACVYKCIQIFRQQKNRKHHSSVLPSKKISARRDSNPRPQPWQGCALPTEPLAHVMCQTQVRWYHIVSALSRKKLWFLWILKYLAYAGKRTDSISAFLAFFASTVFHFCFIWFECIAADRTGIIVFLVCFHFVTSFDYHCQSL